MPLAPHSNALLAGRPRAKRWVLASRVSRWLSMPLSSPISVRDVRVAARSSGASHTNASATLKSGAVGQGVQSLQRRGDAPQRVRLVPLGSVRSGGLGLEIG